MCSWYITAEFKKKIEFQNPFINIFFFGKKIFIVSDQKNRQKNYKQMLYTFTYTYFHRYIG